MPTSPLRRWLLPSLLVLAAFAVGAAARAAEVIPEVPTRYFNDYALAVKPETADRLNKELEDNERQTSNQLRAVIYPKMQSDSSVEDYAVRVFRAWKVGEKGKDNGVVLFVFLQDHKIWIATGRGLEGPLPDAVCKDITADLMAPKFKAGDYDGGMTAGVEAMIAATEGEFKGTGRTRYEQEHASGARRGGMLTIFWVILVLFLLFRAFTRGTGGARGGTMYTGGGPIIWGGGLGGGFGSGGGFGGGSGGGSSDGGGFASSGGGDTGGGGAGSDW